MAPKKEKTGTIKMPPIIKRDKDAMMMMVEKHIGQAELQLAVASYLRTPTISIWMRHATTPDELWHIINTAIITIAAERFSKK